MLKIKLTLAAVAAAFAFSSSAGVLSITEDTGTVQETGGLNSYLVDANELAGMEVTATFLDGFTETVIWTDDGSPNGSASGTLWFVNASGNALQAALVGNLRSSAMTSFTINAAPGDGVFDLGVDFINAGEERTLGTNVGYPFEFLSNNGVDGLDLYDVEVTYSNAVQITGDDYNGDIYTTMTVDILGSGISSFGSIGFRADMDALEISGDIGNPVPVPAPAGILVLMTGLLGLARRKV